MSRDTRESRDALIDVINKLKDLVHAIFGVAEAIEDAKEGKNPKTIDVAPTDDDTEEDDKDDP